MPIFNNCAGFHVHNGTFYEVQGDVNFQRQHTTVQIDEASQQPISALQGRLRLADSLTTKRSSYEAGMDAFHPSDPSHSRILRDSDHVHRDLDTGSRPRSMPFGPSLHASPDSSPRAAGGGIYITAENVNHLRVQDEGFHVLHRSVALEALYDSAESFPQPRCHSETRADMLGNLCQWATKTDPAVQVLWLYGPAGAGKSAIMQTLCQRLHTAGLLGGSFFFKRGHPIRGNGTLLFATLAYQLAIRNRALKTEISKRVEEEPSLVTGSMASQLQELIVQPCKSSTDSSCRVLLIDGLDECDRSTAQQEILRSIGRIFCVQSLPLRIIVASRPEPDIRQIFQEPAFYGRYETANIEQSFEDVRAYLRDEFSRIHREHKETMRAIPKPWPHPDILEELVRNSSGYFIYAATVIRFVDNQDFRPTEQLRALRLPKRESDSPFADLDQMYLQILSTVPVPVRPRLLNILCTIDLNVTTATIEELLQLDYGDVELTCRRLGSILQTTSSGRLAVYHASFYDFLGNPTRSGVFHISCEHKKRLVPSLLNAVRGSINRDFDEASTVAFSVIDWVIDEIPPYAAVDLAPLFLDLNPDFFWCRTDLKGRLEQIIHWLIVSPLQLLSFGATRVRMATSPGAASR
ncbi:hypothetical protein DFH06DRAFT_1095375 [Mycena polygramma]|nr:hypothetical protein DFH06DRAFT_1095375 [Mycena polygramma]